MAEMELVIYALSGVSVVLALILSTRLMKRRKSKPENIWADLEGFPIMPRTKIPVRQTMRPPQPHMFSQR